MAVKGEMDARQYCDAIYRELSEMKTKVFDIVCKIESTSAAEEARRAEYFDLFDIVDYIEKNRISLRRSVQVTGGRQEGRSKAAEGNSAMRYTGGTVDKLWVFVSALRQKR